MIRSNRQKICDKAFGVIEVFLLHDILMTVLKVLPVLQKEDTTAMRIVKYTLYNQTLHCHQIEIFSSNSEKE